MTLSSNAQSNNRIEIEGQVIVDYPDLDGITVFNTSSNKGTITDKEGHFKIKVALNDKVEISALQFKKFTITISELIMEAKSLTVFLVENVNKLDEIVILPYGLSGDLYKDINDVKTIRPNLDSEYFGLDNVSRYDFGDDYKSKVRNLEMDKNEFRYGVDFVKIVGGLLKPIFKNKSSKSDIKYATESFRSKYSTEYLLKRLNIPKEEVAHFVTHIETKGIDLELLEDGKEFQFLDYLIKESKVFLKDEADKN